jgi:hypothetical protein
VATTLASMPSGGRCSKMRPTPSIGSTRMGFDCLRTDVALTSDHADRPGLRGTVSMTFGRALPKGLDVLASVLLELVSMPFGLALFGNHSSASTEPSEQTTPLLCRSGGRCSEIELKLLFVRKLTVSMSSGRLFSEIRGDCMTSRQQFLCPSGHTSGRSPRFTGDDAVHCVRFSVPVLL